MNRVESCSMHPKHPAKKYIHMRNTLEQPQISTPESQPIASPFKSNSKRNQGRIHDGNGVASEKVRNVKQMLDQLCKELPTDIAQELSRSFTKFLQSVLDWIPGIEKEIAEALGNSTPIEGVMIVKALLRRAEDLVREIALAPKESRAFTAELALGELGVEIEHPTDSAIRGIVTLIAEGLQQKEDVHLDELSKNYGPLLQLLQSESQKAMVLRALQSLGYIKPIPALHWRVDRTMDEYQQRSGVRLKALFKEMSQEGGVERTMTVLEVGPGSGQAKKERAHEFEETINDYGISDALYFPITPIIEQMIDFKKLEKESGRLSNKERTLIVEGIAQTIMIRDGQVDQNTIQYDTQRLDQLSRDVNELWPLAEEAVKKLNDRSVLVDTQSAVDKGGTITYPKTISISEQSTAFKKALGLLKHSWGSEWNRFDTIESRGDLYMLMDVHPENVMIADMRSVHRLAPNQVDATIAVRSSVYLEGEAYKQWLKDVHATLSPRGISIDDSVRENFGSSYRIAELLEVQRDLQKTETCHIAIIMGPNVTGEDLRKDNIPGTLVMVKDPAILLTIQKHLLPEYSMRNLSDIAQDREYLHSLDTTGATAQKVSQVLQQRPLRQKKAA